MLHCDMWQDAEEHSQLDCTKTGGGGANGGRGRGVVVVVVVPVVVVAAVEAAKEVIAAQVAAAKETGGEDGAGREATEPEQVLVNVEDEDGPVVEGARGARVGGDEPDAGDDCTDGLFF